MIYTRPGIDSMFNYVGQIDADTTCSDGGSYNYFGQINFYTDSLRKEKVAEMHFVLEGNCAGFYLKKDHYLRRFKMTPEGKAFFAELYNINKSILK